MASDYEMSLSLAIIAQRLEARRKEAYAKLKTLYDLGTIKAMRDYKHLMAMIASPDEENITVAETIINDELDKWTKNKLGKL